MLLLAGLQSALSALGFDSVLARNHRLILWYNHSPCEPSGLTDPELHILTPTGTVIAATDGSTYTVPGHATCPASDPAAAAASIARSYPIQVAR